MAKKMPDQNKGFDRDDLVDSATGDELTNTQRGSGEHEAIYGQEDVSNSDVSWTGNDDDSVSPFFDG
ncbi:hypothetical protein HOB10_02760 [Candidatus Parcubacteria bacterium]|jgi:hypothetical protein|nr:hypothetical protein [Candidatus Parcubacteria bacterium]